jgi:guanylate kinase
MVKDMGDAVKVAVSYAVRKPKEGEEEGVHYRFLGKPDAFKKMLDKGELLENVQIGTEKVGRQPSHRL